MFPVKLFIFLFPVTVFAEMKLSFLSNFIQDNKSISSSNSSSTIYDVSAHIYINRNNNWAVAVGYAGSTSKEPLDDDTEATLTTENPYVGLTWVFGRKSLYSIGAYYSPIVRARYSETSSAEETWSGSSYFVRASVHPYIYKSVMVQLSLTYSSSQYTEKGAENEVSDVDNFSKSTLTPMVGLSFQF